MARIKENQAIGDGDYMLIAVKYHDYDSYKYAAIIGYNGACYFLSNHRMLRGSDYSDNRNDGFRYSWMLQRTNDPIRELKSVNPALFVDIIILANEDYLSYYHESFLLFLIRKGFHGEESSDVGVIEDTEPDFMNRWYENTSIYTGMHQYHSHHGWYLNRPKKSFKYRIGIELEVEFDTENQLSRFNGIESNWFYQERDGSLGSYGCEIITIPLLPSDAKSADFWKPLTDYLTNKASSWDTGRCGLHVHIGREILGKTEEQQSETIGKLLYLYHHFVKDTRLNCKVYGRDRAYNDHDGKTAIGDAAKLLGADVLKSKSVCDKVKKSVTDKSNEGRYFDINLKNAATIEFRKGRGSIKANRIAMVVDYSERMCIYAKNTPWQQIGYDDFVNFLRATNQNEDLKMLIENWA